MTQPTRLTGRFFSRLPVRRRGDDGHLHLLSEGERRHVRRIRAVAMLLAALLSVLGFLAYYLPIYAYPHLFPAVSVALPLAITPVRLAWGEFLWGVLLMILELWALVFLNIASVHEMAVATGFLTAGNKSEMGEAVLQVGREKRAKESRQYGIDPFQGLNPQLLFLFNFVLRLKGWLGNQAIRFLTRLLLGRFAVRAVLDFAGMPLYMAINAYAVHAVLREAQVVFMGQTIVAQLLGRLPRIELSAGDKELFYDTLQYIAVSKRDFHQNHFLLTRELLQHFGIERKEAHRLSDDYADKLRRAPAPVQALCQLVILLGYLLDGQLSWRERRNLRRLNAQGILPASDADVRRYLKDFLAGAGVEDWSEPYLSRLAGGAAAVTRPA